MRGALLALAAVACAAAPSITGGAETSRRPTRAELDAVTERGRLLAGFDSAAARATDAVFALHPDPAMMSRYIAIRSDRGWVVEFGKVDGDVFNVAYEARPGIGAYKADALVPPRAETGYALTAARALDITAGLLRGHRPYNAAVLPAGEGRVFVYAYPGPQKGDEIPLGADVRWLVSADGKKVLEERKLHEGVIPSPPPGAAAQAHTHVLRDAVEDTDVMHALQTHLPQIVTMPSRDLVEIDPEGHITWTAAEDLRKRFAK
ncbi:MAG TPA: hypothetical protein VGH20_14505 [Myxococcales bacterium]